MVSVAVKDFGPIVEGAVEIKPLTVFIGPNNSGKSHLATLVYALMQGTLIPDGPDTLLYDKVMPRISGHVETEIDAWITEKIKGDFDFSSISFLNLPKEFVHVLEDASKERVLSMFLRSFDDSMPRCFGTEISALPRTGNNANGKFSVSLKHDGPVWYLTATPSGNEIDAGLPKLSFASESVNVHAEYLKKVYGAPAKRHALQMRNIPKTRRNRRLRTRRAARLQTYSSARRERQMAFDRFRYEFVREISVQVFNAMYRQFPDRISYLPAARSGILQSHKQLASAIVRRSAFVGIEPIEVRPLSGVVADFISGLLTLDTTHHTKALYEVAEFLEERIAKGKIYLDATGGMPYPEITYETQGQKFRMHRASSMVSELAPLILYLKHRLAPGDLLIFEEPESHLHPANQRILAHAIVKMVRKGVKVMITTHSDYFLPQLSNFVRLSALPDERARRGYDDDDYLNPDDVGCYLFAWDGEEGGSMVRELEVSAEEGVIEDEFYDVSESLYNEYVDLERAAIKSSIK